MPLRVIALDLERTLISDAYNREPRPGLFEFLQFCLQAVERVVLFTAVSKRIAMMVLNDLSAQGAIPDTFVEQIEYIEWDGSYKDLRYIPQTSLPEVVIVDDDEGWILPEQQAHWIGIAAYDPYLIHGEDTELLRVRRLLEERIAVS